MARLPTCTSIPKRKSRAATQALTIAHCTDHVSVMKHFIFVLFAALTGLFFVTRPSEAPKILLSEYGFFRGELQKLEPADGVFHYEVNAPLFSDYAEKARFIYLPEGAQIAWNDSTAFQFPDGAAIIKNFYYPNDASKPDAVRRILETRLL